MGSIFKSPSFCSWQRGRRVCEQRLAKTELCGQCGDSNGFRETVGSQAWKLIKLCEKRRDDPVTGCAAQTIAEI